MKKTEMSQNGEKKVREKKKKTAQSDEKSVKKVPPPGVSEMVEPQPSEPRVTKKKKPSGHRHKESSSTTLRKSSKAAAKFKENLDGFNDKFGSGPVQLGDCCKEIPLRGFRSDPNTPMPLGAKFELREIIDGDQPDQRKCNSMEDFNIQVKHYPDLMKREGCHRRSHHGQPKGHVKVAMTERMQAAYDTMAEIESRRFSFYDAIVKKGIVLESIEQPKAGEPESFVVAEDKQVKDGLDYARVVYKTKNSYTGNLKAWYFHGPGRYTWTDGTSYQGNFRDGEMDGEGVLLWPEGSLYEGEFFDGMRSGWGVLSLADKKTYAGEWENGVPHGKGKIWYDGSEASVDYYDGDWVNGLQEGHGTRQYANGDRYMGQWKDGQRSGHGTFVWFSERQVYKGEWKNGVPQGQGEHIWYLPRTEKSLFPTRHIYIGEWFEGMRHGVGRMIYSCGSLYEGHWEMGMRHEKGLYVNSSGDVLIGIFRAGSISGGVDVPLHSPTYECDFKGVCMALGENFGLEDFIAGEDEKLTFITLKYIKQIRILYKRAGDLGYWWGDNGHFPLWAKKNIPLNPNAFAPTGRHCGPVEENYMKSPSPDGVYPLTRLGLWLLIKDCTGLDEDVAISHYDDTFNLMPSISFQTWHNPFEPVFLWQFLQCLVVIASVAYIEIPMKKKNQEAAEASAEGTKEECEELIKSGKKHVKKPLADKPNLMEKAENDVVKNEIVNKKMPKLSGNPDGSKTTMQSKSMQFEVKDSKTSIRSDANLAGSKNSSTADDYSQKKGKAHQSRKKIEKCFTITGRKSETMSFSDVYEKLLVEVMFPWLERDPGLNLPTIPKPLPPLPDLYNAFISNNAQDESLQISEVLCHIMPSSEGQSAASSKTSVRSERSARSESIGGNDRKRDESSESDRSNASASSRASTSSVHDKNLTIMGLKIGDISKERRNSFLSDFKGLVENEKKNPGHNDHVEGDSDFDEEQIVLESTPFGEEDLIPEPFLWKQDLKCKVTKKTEQAFNNLTPDDITEIVQHLYPKLCRKFSDFKILFCDWIWIMSLCAKVSNEREFTNSIRKLLKFEKSILEKGDEKSKLDEKRNCESNFPKNVFPGNRGTKPDVQLAAAAYMNTRKLEINRVKYQLS